jgi:hypothetical protein
MSRTAFNARFPDNAACARYLFSVRWPEGFVCPGCKSRKGWELKTRLYTYECACCAKQTSVTAGTVMHRSKLPLLVWFQAIHIMTSHSNGISAEQAQAQLGLGSYKTAWLLLMKLRRAMADPARSLLSGIVEVDETEVPLRSKHDPIAGYGIANVGILLIAGAVELSDGGHPKRIRLEPLKDKTGPNIRGFVERVVEKAAAVFSDGLASYKKLAQHKHTGKTVGELPAHVFLPWIHRVFANLKRWLLGTLHGVRKPHLSRYLDEFVFRWNRRRSTASAFGRLLGFAAQGSHASMRDFIGQKA